MAQTKIAVPKTKIEFNDLGSARKSQKEFLKEARLVDRLKTGELKEVRKSLKNNTSFSRDSIKHFENALKVFDLQELNQINSDLDKIKRFKKQKASINKYSIDSLKKQNVDVGLNRLKDLEEFKKYDELKSSYIGKEGSVQSYRKTFKSPGGYDSLKLVAKDELSTRLGSQMGVDSVLWDSVKVGNTDAQVRNYLNREIEKKIKQKFDLTEYLADDELEPSTKQYIASLEKFDFEKVSIPDEKLTEALLQKEIEEKKEKARSVLSRDSLIMRTSKKPSKRWQLGGYMQYIPQPRSIEVTPTLAIFLREKWLLGLGYVNFISLRKEEANIKGYRVFVEPYLSRGYFVHLESQWLYKAVTEETTVSQRSTLLGIGKSLRYQSIKTDVILLYNFQTPNEFQSQNVTVKFGINFLE